MRQMTFFLTLQLLTACVTAEPASPQACKKADEVTPKVLINTDEHGIAVQGYDVVNYFTAGQPARGTPEYQTTYDHATYLFASAEHQQLFEKSPEKYVPKYGGFCGYGAAAGHVIKVDPEYWSIENQRLILQNGRISTTLWDLNVQSHIEKADKNWPELVQEQGHCPQ